MGWSDTDGLQPVAEGLTSRVRDRMYEAGNAEDVILGVHDDTLSDDPQVACSARALKALLPGMIAWVELERARGTDKVTVLAALGNMTVSLVGTGIMNQIPTGTPPAARAGAFVGILRIVRASINEHVAALIRKWEGGDG